MNPTVSSHTTKQLDQENLTIWKEARNKAAQSLERANNLLDSCTQENYSKGIAWAHGNIGAANLWLSNYEEALEHTMKARDLLRKEEDFEHEVDILYNLCVIFYFLGEYEKQITYAKEALELAKKN